MAPSLEFSIEGCVNPESSASMDTVKVHQWCRTCCCGIDGPTRLITQATNSKIIIDSRDYMYKKLQNNKGADNAKVQWEVQREAEQSA